MSPNEAYDAWKAARVGTNGFNPRTVFLAGFDKGYIEAGWEQVEKTALALARFEFSRNGDRWLMTPETESPSLFKWQLSRDEGGYWADWCSVQSIRDAYATIDRAVHVGSHLMEACS